MIMAEMAAFDNVKELTDMADNLTTFVQQAAVSGTAAHEAEKTDSNMQLLPSQPSSHAVPR